MSTTAPQPYIPRPDELDLEFYRATVAAGALCVQRCDACGSWTHPARYYCPQCSSGKFSFARASGRATVHSFTISHFSVEPAWKSRAPYASVVAELEEGPRIVAAVRGIPHEALHIGLKLRIVTENRSPDFAFFWAEPAE